VNEDVRRWHVDAAWPYGIVYLVEGDTLIIVAIHHDRRLPRRWTSRLTSSHWQPTGGFSQDPSVAGASA
jgi:hypothetical protein